MPTPSTITRRRTVADAEITYVTDNQHDAEAIQHQMGNPVRIQRAAVETVLYGLTEIRIRRHVVGQGVQDVLDV